MDKCTKKIIDNDDKYVIFYSDWCRYSMDAIGLLKDNKKSFKGYKIDKMKGGINKLISCLKKTSNQTEFDTDHMTRPIIFYKGKFVGGYTQLSELLDV